MHLTIFQCHLPDYILSLFALDFVFQTSVTTTSESECSTKPKETPGSVPVEEMTSKDYYFDSYGHFGIHEVSLCFDLFLFQFCAPCARHNFRHVSRDLIDILKQLIQYPLRHFYGSLCQSN